MVKLFDFYLDAWLFCQEHKLNLDRVYRDSWKHWAIELIGDEVKYVPE